MLPVVLPMKFHLVRQAALLRPLLGDAQLLGGERQPGDGHSVPLRQVQGQAAPAAADVQHPLAGP